MKCSSEKKSDFRMAHVDIWFLHDPWRNHLHMAHAGIRFPHGPLWFHKKILIWVNLFSFFEIFHFFEKQTLNICENNVGWAYIARLKQEYNFIYFQPCIGSLMPNIIKKSWTVSSRAATIDYLMAVLSDLLLTWKKTAKNFFETTLVCY